MTAEMRHNVFLSFKEALHNVAKHSRATEVSVSLATNERGFTLMIRDNGKGFSEASLPPPRLGHGNGLKNMRQRLETIGGHCDIRSVPGAGAEIQFSVAVPVTAPTTG